MKNNKTTRIVPVRFNEEEFEKLNALLEQYNFQNRSNFIKKCIFKKQIHYVAIDQELDGCYEKLTRLIFEYNKVAVNYNQVVKRLHVTFGKNKAAELLKALHQDTLSLNNLTQKIMPVVQLLKRKYDCQNQ